MNKKTVKSLMAVAFVFAISLYFIGGTYARYATEFEGEATAEVAKWAVKLTDDGSGTAGDGESLSLDLVPEKSDHVVDGKIAPTSTLSKTVKISLDGTETSVKFEAEVDTAQLVSKLTEAGVTTTPENSDLKITTAVSYEGTNGTLEGNVVKLNETGKTSGFGADDVVTVTITLEWDKANASAEAHNTTHTEMGESETLTNAKGLSFPATLTVSQYTGE